MDNFERNLRQIINKFGVDSNVGIPDFVLAQVINEMLEKAEKQRWRYGDSCDRRWADCST